MKQFFSRLEPVRELREYRETLAGGRLSVLNAALSELRRSIEVLRAELEAARAASDQPGLSIAGLKSASLYIRRLETRMECLAAEKTLLAQRIESARGEFLARHTGREVIERCIHREKDAFRRESLSREILEQDERV